MHLVTRSFILWGLPKFLKTDSLPRFISPQTYKMKSGIISSIVPESSTQGVIFATATFGVSIDSLDVKTLWIWNSQSCFGDHSLGL